MEQKTTGVYNGTRLEQGLVPLVPTDYQIVKALEQKTTELFNFLQKKQGRRCLNKIPHPVRARGGITLISFIWLLAQSYCNPIILPKKTRYRDFRSVHSGFSDSV